MTDELPDAVKPTGSKIPVAADTLAVGAVGRVADDDKVVPRKQVISWAMWDWATQPFNSVILTFVFASLYLVSDNFLPADIAALPDGDGVKEQALAGLTAGYGLATTLAGVLIFLLAPVLGQRADASGMQKRLLLLFTGILALIQFGLFFVFAQKNQLGEYEFTQGHSFHAKSEPAAPPTVKEKHEDEDISFASERKSSFSGRKGLLIAAINVGLGMTGAAACYFLTRNKNKPEQVTETPAVKPDSTQAIKPAADSLNSKADSATTTAPATINTGYTFKVVIKNYPSLLLAQKAFNRLTG